MTNLSFLMVYTARSFWVSLEANTGILDTIWDLKSQEGIFTLSKDILSREFTRITITNRNLAMVVALKASTLRHVPI